MNITKTMIAVLMAVSMMIATSCDKDNDNDNNEQEHVDPSNYVAKNEAAIAKASIAMKVEIEPTDYTFYDYLRSQEFNAFKAKIGMFANKAAVAIGANSDGNTAISPVALFMALAMAAESANGDTRQEILDAMGVTYEELNANMLYLNYICNQVLDNGGSQSNGQNQIKCVNSLWVQNGVKVKDEGVKALTTKYYSDLFYMNFDEDDVNSILTSYISNETHGLLSPDLDVKPDVLLILMNVVYLRDIWNRFGNEFSFTDQKYDFVNYDQSKTNTQLLCGHYNSGKAMETDVFRKFYISTNGELKLTFIVPQDGHSLDEIYTTEVLNAPSQYITYDTESDPQFNYSFHTRCLFPEFKAVFDDYLQDVFKKMGVKKFFNEFSCDFSNLTDELVYCSKFRHITKLEVTRKGIEGAAVAYESMDRQGSAGPGQKEKVWKDVYFDFPVDRDFAYILSKDNIPIFTGVVKSINK